MAGTNPGRTGMVCWYAMDTGAITTDSHAGNTLTNTNVTNGTGLVNADAVFDAAGDSLTIAIPSSFDFGSGTDTFTFVGWVKFTTQTGNHGIVGQNTTESYRIDWYANTMRLIVWTDAGAASTASVAQSGTGAWVMVAAWRSGTNIYISVNNGTAGTQTSASMRPGAGNWCLGRPQGLFLPGELDEVCMYSRALSADELTWLYNAGSGRAYSETATAAGLPVIAWEHAQVFGA